MEGRVAPGGGRRIARYVYVVLAVLFLLGVGVQVFLAGLGLFAGVDLELHRSFGWMLGGISILALLAALIARSPRRVIVDLLILNVLVHLQGLLMVARESAPVLAALHPLNAMFVFGLAAIVAHRAFEEVPEASLLGRARRRGVPARVEA